MFISRDVTEESIGQKLKPKNFVSNYIFVVIFVAVFFVAAGVITPTASAAPLLRCTASYYGVSHVIDARLSADPYDIEAVDIEGRFRFKAVMVGARQRIDYIKLYAYFQSGGRDVPIHQATYLPPFKHSSKAVALTPKNHLYAGDYERELHYHCTLHNPSHRPSPARKGQP
jgi:hypothetical protein